MAGLQGLAILLFTLTFEREKNIYSSVVRESCDFLWLFRHLNTSQEKGRGNGQDAVYLYRDFFILK